MDRKEVKKILKSSCRGVLNDLLEDVGFTADEKKLFTERYINDHSVVMCCFLIPCGHTKYHKLHNNILDKIISYYLRTF